MIIRFIHTFVLAVAGTFFLYAQDPLKWETVSQAEANLPPSLKLMRTQSPMNGKPNIAWCVIADLKDPKLTFTTDTSLGRRLTPAQFYTKNKNPLVLMNGTFFEFVTNRNLNVVVRDGKLASYNLHSIAQKGKDTLTFLHPFRSAIGIDAKGNADVAWIYSDSSTAVPWASQTPVDALRDSSPIVNADKILKEHSFQRFGNTVPLFEPWKVKTAIGGGPVLVQNGKVMITNNEERMFVGKAIDDLHPRSAMGYTADGKLVMLVVEGRAPGRAEGASLRQLANMMLQLGCVEALNLDGGGSSCMLVNGRETIKPSDKEGQRPVPAVWMILQK